MSSIYPLPLQFAICNFFSTFNNFQQKKRTKKSKKRFPLFGTFTMHTIILCAFLLIQGCFGLNMIRSFQVSRKNELVFLASFAFDNNPNTSRSIILEEEFSFTGRQEIYVFNATAFAYLNASDYTVPTSLFLSGILFPNYGKSTIIANSGFYEMEKQKHGKTCDLYRSLSRSWVSISGNDACIRDSCMFGGHGFPDPWVIDHNGTKIKEKVNHPQAFLATAFCGEKALGVVPLLHIFMTNGGGDMWKREFSAGSVGLIKVTSCSLLIFIALAIYHRRNVKEVNSMSIRARQIATTSSRNILRTLSSTRTILELVGLSNAIINFSLFANFCIWFHLIFYSDNGRGEAPVYWLGLLCNFVAQFALLLSMNKLISCWIPGERYDSERGSWNFYAIRTADHVPFLFTVSCFLLIADVGWKILGICIRNPLALFENRGIATGFTGYASIWEIIIRSCFAICLTLVAVVTHLTAPSENLRRHQNRISFCVLLWAYLFPFLQMYLHFRAFVSADHPIPEPDYVLTSLSETVLTVYGLAILLFLLAPPSDTTLKLLDRKTELTGRHLRRAQARHLRSQSSMDASERSLLSTATTHITGNIIATRRIGVNEHNEEELLYEDSPMFENEYIYDEGTEYNEVDDRMIRGINEYHEDFEDEDEETF